MKRGFTLVELLGVLVILSILLLIAFTSVSSIIKNSRNTVYNKQISSILSGAYDFTLKYPNELPKKKNEIKYVSLLKLQKNGFVDELINPKNKELFPVDMVVQIKYTGGNYKYDSPYSKLYGSYLYTVLVNDTNKSNNPLLKPSIKIDGLEEIEQGVYYYKFDIGNEYVSYSPTVGDNVDVITVILDNLYDKGGNDVWVIDTTKKGIYYKYFIAIDANGNSNYIVQNIVIDDTVAPTLTIPDNDEIAKSVISYDLMKDVSCTDNSTKCTITTEGKIKFGTPDSYQIKYIAKDPSGNTTTKTRTIRVLNE